MIPTQHAHSKPSAENTMLTIPDSVKSDDLAETFYKKWLKAGMIFAAGSLGFVGLKATGTFSAISNWMSNEDLQNTNLDDKTMVRVEDTSALSTIPDKQPIISSQSDEYINSGDTLNIKYKKERQLVEFNELPISQARKVKKEQNVERNEKNKQSTAEHSTIKLQGVEPPALGNNTLNIEKGATIILTSDMLSATDPDDDDSALTFYLSNIQYGQFEFTLAPGTPITQFTQQNLLNGYVCFKHDDGTVAPHYEVSVGDGVTITGPSIPSLFFYGTDIPYGSEFMVNSHTANSQSEPAIAKLFDDKFVVVWESDAQDGDGYGIYGKIYNGDGTNYGNEFRVNTYTSNDQRLPAVAGLPNGKFVIVWKSNSQDNSGYGIYGQMYHANGTKHANEFQANTYTANEQEYPIVAGLLDSKFIVVWSSYEQDGSHGGVYGQMFNADGTDYASEFRVNTYTANYQTTPAITVLSDGKFVVVWKSKFQNDGDYGIYGQIYNSDKSNYGNEFHINTYTSLDQHYPDVAGLSDGKFIVVWSSYEQDGSHGGVYGQLFNNDGTNYDNEFIINTYTLNYQTTPSVAGLSNGKFVVIWKSKYQDSSEYGVYGQIYYSDVTKYGNEFLINTYTLLDQELPAVAKLSDNKFVVVWKSDNQDGSNAGIYGQIYGDMAPKLLKNKLTINTNQSIVLSNANLAAIDLDNDNLALLFKISSLHNGSFEIITNSGVPVTNFTQTKILLGQVKFIHESNKGVPSYSVSVDDGRLSTFPMLAGVLFNNDCPVLTTNSLTINEDQTILITSAYLAATDAESNDADLIFMISNINNGQFELISNPGVSITNFIQAQVTANQVRFVHDGSENAPSYDVVVNDGTDSTVPASANITFTSVNDLPVLTTNSLTINEHQTISITNANLAATDAESNDADLTFIISNMNNGQFELVSNPGVPITNFTQAQVTANQVRFVHDGNENAPSYDVVVNDGVDSTVPASASITFNTINDAPIITGSGGIFAYTENDIPKIVDSGIIISDPDSAATLSSATVQITGYIQNEDMLNWDDTYPSINSNFNPSTGKLTLTGIDSIANYQSALRSVTYYNLLNNPTTGVRTISFMVNDGEANSNIVGRNLNVIPVNDAPVLTGSGGVTFYTNTDAAIIIDFGISISDVDSNTLEGATIQIVTGYVQSEDILEFTNTASITSSFDPFSGTLTLIGSDSAVNYELALRSIQYKNLMPERSPHTRSIIFTVNDGVQNSNVVMRNINVVTNEIDYWKDIGWKVFTGIGSSAGALFFAGFLAILKRNSVISKRWNNKSNDISRSCIANMIREKLKLKGLSNPEEGKGSDFLAFFEKLVEALKEKGVNISEISEQYHEKVASYLATIIKEKGFIEPVPHCSFFCGNTITNRSTLRKGAGGTIAEEAAAKIRSIVDVEMTRQESVLIDIDASSSPQL